MKYYFTFLFLWVFYYAYACSCASVSEIKSAVKYADMLFDGTLVESTIISDSISGKYSPLFIRVKHSFAINEVFKGKKSLDTVIVFSGMGGGDCGYEFMKGKRYIVYSAKHKHQFEKKVKHSFYSTNICTRTKEYDTAEVRNIRVCLKNK